MGYKIADVGRKAREFLLLRRGPWPSEEALSYQHQFVADMQEIEAKLASDEEDTKIGSMVETQDDLVDDDDDGLTISFIVGSDDYLEPLDMVVLNEQTVINLHVVPDHGQQESQTSTSQQNVPAPEVIHQDLPNSSHQPEPPGLVVPLDPSSYAFSLQQMALELMRTAQPIPFPPPILPPQLMLPTGPRPEYDAPSLPEFHPRGTERTSHRRNQVSISHRKLKSHIQQEHGTVPL